MKQIFDDPNLQGTAERESEKLERTRLVDAVAREEYLKSTYGSSHPAVKAARTQIETLQKQIDLARKKEQQMADEAAEARLKNRPFDIAAKQADSAATDSAATDSAATDLAATDLAATDFATAVLAAQPVGEEQAAEQASAEVGPEQQTDYFLAMSVNALTEKYQALGLVEGELQERANEDRQKSLELQAFLRRNNLIKERLAYVKQLHSELSEKLKAVDLASGSTNHKVLKELTRLRLATSTAPIRRYTVGGARWACC